MADEPSDPHLLRSAKRSWACVAQAPDSLACQLATGGRDGAWQAAQLVSPGEGAPARPERDLRTLGSQSGAQQLLHRAQSPARARRPGICWPARMVSNSHEAFYSPGKRAARNRCISALGTAMKSAKADCVPL